MIGPYEVQGLKSAGVIPGCRDPEDPEDYMKIACEHCILSDENPDFFEHLSAFIVLILAPLSKQLLQAEGV
jgi:hypothetical protein